MGVTIGAACGAVAVVAVIAGALWFTRKKWMGRLRRRNSESRYDAEGTLWDKKSQSSFSNDAPNSPSRFNSPEDFDDLGRNKRYYSVTNPDPPSTGSARFSYEAESSSMPPRGEIIDEEGSESPTGVEDDVRSDEDDDRESRVDEDEDQMTGGDDEPPSDDDGGRSMDGDEEPQSDAEDEGSIGGADESQADDDDEPPSDGDEEPESEEDCEFPPSKDIESQADNDEETQEVDEEVSQPDNDDVSQAIDDESPHMTPSADWLSHGSAIPSPLRPGPTRPMSQYTAFRPVSVTPSAYGGHEPPNSVLRNMMKPPPSLPQHYSVASNPHR